MSLAVRFQQKQENPGLNMATKIEKTINGRAISANPVFKDGARPAYWSCAINDRIIAKIFSSASEVFRFAENIKQH